MNSDFFQAWRSVWVKLHVILKKISYENPKPSFSLAMLKQQFASYKLHSQIVKTSLREWNILITKSWDEFDNDLVYSCTTETTIVAVHCYCFLISQVFKPNRSYSKFLKKKKYSEERTHGDRRTTELCWGWILFVNKLLMVIRVAHTL